MFKGFFNRMYNGNPNKPDIDPEDMPKNRFELFFTTLGLRFGDLIKLNLLFVVTMIPMILWGASFLIMLNAELGTPQPAGVDAASIIYSVSFWHLLFLPVFLMLAGPPLAGLTYVARNYARDEHAWLWSDFKEQMKKNWKQSMGVMFLLGIVIFVAFVTNNMYSAIIAQQGQSLMWVMRMLFIIFIGLFLLSYMYMFPMLVTYKLRMGQIFKNSLMLALGRLPFTLLFAFLALFPLLVGGILEVNFIAAQSAAANYVLLALVLYYLLLGFSLTSFILNSYTNATFDKLLKSEDDTPPNDNDREVMP